MFAKNYSSFKNESICDSFLKIGSGSQRVLRVCWFWHLNVKMHFRASFKLLLRHTFLFVEEWDWTSENWCTLCLLFSPFILMCPRLSSNSRGHFLAATRGWKSYEFSNSSQGGYKQKYCTLIIYISYSTFHLFKSNNGNMTNISSYQYHSYFLQKKHFFRSSTLRAVNPFSSTPWLFVTIRVTEIHISWVSFKQ